MTHFEQHKQLRTWKWRQSFVINYSLVQYAAASKAYISSLLYSFLRSEKFSFFGFFLEQQKYKFWFLHKFGTSQTEWVFFYICWYRRCILFCRDLNAHKSHFFLSFWFLWCRVEFKIFGSLNINLQLFNFMKCGSDFFDYMSLGKYMTVEYCGVVIVIPQYL